MSRSPFIGPLGFGPFPAVLPGSLTVLANGINVTGNSTITGTLGGLTGLTIASGGMSVTGNSTITGTLGGITGLTVASGGMTVTAGGITVTGNSTITGTLGGLTGLTVASGGASIGGSTTLTPTAGRGLTVNGVSATHSMRIADSATALFNAGYLESPINAQGTPYTCVLADSGKTIYYSGTGAASVTIPANASVPYPLGTVLTFVNDATGATNMTIAITSDVMVLSPTGTTGSRTLAQFGRAVAEKVTATRWIIGGTGLT
jgi:hypothetical protein